MGFDGIPHRALRQAQIRPNSPGYHQKVGGAWKATSWAEYAKQIRRAGKALIALGLQPGQTVSILGFNRPEWAIFFLGAMAAGGVPAGIYTTSSPDEVRYIVHHAESLAILLENEGQWRKVEKEQGRTPLLKYAVMMQGAARPDHPMAPPNVGSQATPHPAPALPVLSWEEFLAKGDAVADERLDERLAAIEPGGLATLIYTSGTTGPPKGVMLSHENLAWTAEFARDLNHVTSADSNLSYLPLSHIAEQVFTIHAPVTAGSSVYFAESIEKVPDNLKEVQPTIFFGVPRIWEKFHAGIRQKLGEAPPARKKIAELAMRVGKAYNEAVNEGKQPSPLLAAGHALFDKLVYSKLKPAVGLGRVRVCVSGAAPIAREVLDFFLGLDIPIREVYGQSEDTGPTSFNLPGRTRTGSVGPPIAGVEVKIADDGEILVKGPNVFMGYYKEPEATAETLKDGWLHSGDLGTIDADGYLWITGRKKEIIITAGGKNIAPKNIEGALKNHTLIAEAVVIGDRRKFLTAVIALDTEAAGRFAKERNIAGSPADHPEIRAAIQRAIDEVNTTLAQVETVKKFHLVPRPFSIETGELTATLKVKRKVVHQMYAREIEAMYEE